MIYKVANKMNKTLSGKHGIEPEKLEKKSLNNANRLNRYKKKISSRS